MRIARSRARPRAGERSRAPIDVPPFDRANVDGFAIRAADTAGAADSAPKQIALNPEVIACGHAPKIEVKPGTGTTIATGGVVPRGADAVVMIEHTELIESIPAIELPPRRDTGTVHLLRRFRHCARRDPDAQGPGDRLARDRHAGGLRVGLDRRGAAAEGRGAFDGDELVTLGDTLRPGGVTDSNGAILAAAAAEAGGEPVAYGAFPDDVGKLEQAVRRALNECDMVVLSGGTSKGAGDLSHRIVSQLGKPGILVHGVALKPGKPLCLAVADGKPIAVLPGFPTSAIFTFHAFVAPVIRARAGLPPEAAQTLRRACRCGSPRRWAARSLCWYRSFPATRHVAFPRRKAPAR
jgi:putative molybdopterin biosynthesis protein